MGLYRYRYCKVYSICTCTLYRHI